MNQDELKKIIESTDLYDENREDGLRAMIGDFYSRKMLPTALLVWGMGIVFMAGAVLSGIMFFMTGITQYQIMWAVIFIICVQMKIFAWQMIHRNSIKREIKRLELRIVEMGQKIGDKPQEQ
ncbi:MAG: DUF6768 family protein [Planctomycetota bacterium]|jgi:hypothetical protein